MGEVFKYIFLHKKRMLKIGIVISLIVVLILFSAAQYLIVLLDGGTNNDKGNVPSAIRKYNEGLFGNNGIGVEGDENGYWYKIDFNEVLKDIIEELEKEDGKLDVYLSSSNKVKILKKMIKAEYITQYPDLRRAGGDYRKENVNKPDPNDINSDINDDISLVGTEGYVADYKKFQGCIEFKRHTSDNKEILLHYTTYDDLKNKIKGGASDLLEYFSVDSQGNLVVATYTKTTTKKLEREPFEEEREEDDIKGEGEGNFNFYKGHLDNERTTTTEEIVYTERKLNYKSLVKKYTMPFEYLWGLLVCGRDEEFVSDLADLVLDSKIEIGIYDNLTEIEDMQVDTWREKIYSASKDAQKNIKIVDEGNSNPASEYDVIKWKDDSNWNWNQELNNPISSIRYYNVDYKKTDINTCTNKIAYADIWYVKEEIKGELVYTRTESKPVESIKIKDSEKRINDLNEFLKDENREDLKPGANSGEDHKDTNTPDNPNNVICKWEDNGSDKSYYDVNTLDNLGDFLKSKTEEEDKNKKLEYEKGNWNPSYADIHSGVADGQEYWKDGEGNEYLETGEQSDIQYRTGDIRLKYYTDGVEKYWTDNSGTKYVQDDRGNIWRYEEWINDGDYYLVYKINTMNDANKNEHWEDEATNKTYIKDPYGNICHENGERYLNIQNGSKEYWIEQGTGNRYIKGKDGNGKTYWQDENGKNRITKENSSIEYEAYRTDTIRQTIETGRTQGNYYKKTEGKYTVPTAKATEKTDKNLKEGDEGYPNFCTLYLNSKCARNNITGVESWLFEILQTSEKTTEMLDLTKYLLYKATGRDFGVKDFNSIYSSMPISNFSSGIGGYVVKMAEGQKIPREKIIEAIEGCGATNGTARKNNLTDKGVLDALEEIQEKGVNPLFAIAVITNESGAGTIWGAIDARTHNWASITGTYNGEGYTDGNGRLWRSYPSFKEATLDFGDLIVNGSRYFAAGNVTIESIGKAGYCVPPEGWITNVSKIMKDLCSAIGITIGDTMIGNENANSDGWTGKHVNSRGETFTEFKQFMGPWINYPYAGTTMRNAGCYPTAAAILASAYDDSSNPWEVYEKAGSGPYANALGYLRGKGFQAIEVHNLTEYSSSSNNYTIQISNETVWHGDWNGVPEGTYEIPIVNLLANGNLVMIHIKTVNEFDGVTRVNRFTNDEHWMALIDVKKDEKDDKYYICVSDPGSTEIGDNGWVELNELMYAAQDIILCKKENIELGIKDGGE